ncbi:DUF4124 domain-containing protein [Psychrobacter sp. NZS113]|uniref:DUF4124 domain-containing protein n=1 Tax=Psychrobacter sp. NZS113 TaxID=2792045 RepID=UPI0018CE374B|nr:DUF4124 domain-containing protein [Psychrobacter sp. NZS113]MBH0095608.1 DUF4124 domain-containing protein [Psychrobacter sp. NZS113]
MISLSKLIFSKGNIGLLTAMIMSAASLYAPLANASAIYKVVDEKTGQVTFTDRPQNYEQQEDKQVSQTSVMTSSDAFSSSNNSNASSQSSSTAQTPTAETTITPDADSPSSLAVTTAVSYQLTITEPSEERAYRRPAQSIDVKVQVDPALQAGDNVSIYLDGDEMAQGLSASIPTLDILPGSHSITAVVTDKAGGTLQQVERTIYVIQNNTTLQDNKRKAEQISAYQNLSLYQKLLLKLSQSD